MIVDCYTHTWEPSSAGGHPQAGALARRPADSMSAGATRHLAASQPVDRTIVLGFQSRYLNVHIPNEHVADYVRKHPERLIGFAGVDPSDLAVALAELARAHDEFGLVGLSIAPAAQDFHPTDSRAMRIYAEAARRGMPIVFHHGLGVTSATKLVYGQPILLDEVAREWPTLKIVIAHMGIPWAHETIALLEKHANVFAEISGLLHEPWTAYQVLLTAYQRKVMDKLLFGSGFPEAPASACIESLYGLNHLCQGTNLPTIPREQLRGIVERETLTLLGLSPATGRPRPIDDPDEA